ncbi:MAG: formate dehydrogenase accessory sulfurtransferase FdhD [Chloroflexi bacterium]|nr:MAG: formate dehydrogenase accessory sulfurtransferase FdhD [Chloroflexota bacterium]
MPVSERTTRRRILHLDGTQQRWRTDEVAGEEPLEIRIGGVPLALTMRTPGHDFELAIGFLFTEGVVGEPSHIRSIRTCAAKQDAARSGVYNILDVTLAPGAPPFDPRGGRNFYTTSSCGVCGKASIEALQTRARWQVRDDPLMLDPALLAALPDRLREAQRVFERTGGLHGAALFDAAGNLVCLREDVGRHNAFDKVVGWAAGEGRLPLRSHVILASGRASFELTQKALMAGIPALVAISAPSSLAIELADDAGMTLVGFLRGPRMNVYAGHHRIVAVAAVTTA